MPVIDARILHVTERAALVESEGMEEWIPLSAIEESHDDLLRLAAQEGTQEIDVADWKLRDLGWADA